MTPSSPVPAAVPETEPADQPGRQPRAVKVRRIDFDDAFDDLPRHFMAGDLVMSHAVSTLSSLFPDGLFASLVNLRRSPFLTREVVRRIRAYNRRDFHPDDRDSAALIASWRVELFGDEGVLADRLAS